jgi:site-specific DNA-methyltransferase (adenine-specific)
MKLNVIHLGDCGEVFSSYPDGFADVIVTDAPYGMGRPPDTLTMLRAWLEHGYLEVKGTGFMGRKWDRFVPQPNTWKELYRILKPGGHVVCFFGTRTYDLGVLAMRIAGFEIRDQLLWLYGSGMPKSLDVGKEMDKMAGATRPVVGKYVPPSGKQWNLKQATLADGEHAPGLFTSSGRRTLDITAPVTNAAQKWDGYGTGLRPGVEPIVLARKPLSEPNVCSNLLRHGVGALNIDAGRIPFVSEEDKAESVAKNQHADFGTLPGGNAVFGDYSMVPRENYNPEGRWPSNVVHDGSDEVVGMLRSFDPAGPARFFYSAKAQRADRDYGLEDAEPVMMGMSNGAQKGGEGYSKGQDIGFNRVIARKNHFNTVKPISVMQWLIKLVAPPGGIILEPFAGSGTTCVAADLLGYLWVAAEFEEETHDLACRRVKGLKKGLFA